jgi:uncharacterized membrane protein HdeD (DUF308 family)
MTDVWSYRAVVFALCFISSSVVIGGISLADRDKKMPQELTAMASGCVGALIGFLVPSPRRNE